MIVNYFKHYTEKRTSTQFSDFEVQMGMYYLSQTDMEVTLKNVHALFKEMLQHSYSDDPRSDTLYILSKEINLGVRTFVEARCVIAA